MLLARMGMLASCFVDKVVLIRSKAVLAGRAFKRRGTATRKPNEGSSVWWKYRRT